MKTIMNANDLTTIEQLEEFLVGTQPAAFGIEGDKDARYRWVQQTLVKFRYRDLSKPDKGTVLRYLAKISGYSRAQLTRLVRQYRERGRVVRRQRTANGFARRYTRADIRLLARMDQRHGTPNGLAMKKLCERAWQVFGERGFERLAGISVSHLYNLRKSAPYLQRRRPLEKTRPKACNIGERRKPAPGGRPGYLRIDTVHQGDHDGHKGVYHINVVDEVTQMQHVLSAEKISEAYLVPVLEELLAGFPFVIRGFHSDNGSEYLNRRVARLLEKLRIEFTKSRARQTNDNALVECKNGHVVRKFFGHNHISQCCADLINDFNRRWLNPYLNYHRPCLFAETITDAKGRQRKRYSYDLTTTPYEKFKSLPQAEQYLKPGMSFAILDDIAYRQSDNQAADELQQAGQRLFNSIHERERKRA